MHMRYGIVCNISRVVYTAILKAPVMQCPLLLPSERAAATCGEWTGREHSDNEKNLQTPRHGDVWPCCFASKLLPHGSLVKPAYLYHVSPLCAVHPSWLRARISLSLVFRPLSSGGTTHLSHLRALPRAPFTPANPRFSMYMPLEAAFRA
jgi:hypothetical protein